MSRVGNKIKAGFFATPPKQGEYLKQIVEVKGPGAWFDPTCGEGAILAQLAEGNEDIATYGVELDKGRALKAKEALDHCIQAPIESCVIQNNVFSFLFLNPPYDHTQGGDSKTERKELIELRRNFRYLADGGLMVFIIPSYRFSNESIARFLAVHFENVGILRFSDEDYEDFRQVLFIGNKKKSKYKELNEPLYQFLLQLEDDSFVKQKVTPINLLVGKHTFTIPKGEVGLHTFYTKLEGKENYYEGILESKGFQVFMNRLQPRDIELSGDPIMPITVGQSALLLGSGMINGVVGEGETQHAVQGLEIVSTIRSEEIIDNPNGSRTTVIKERTKRDVSVKIITPKGIVKKLV
jgi:tRNA1(Val) A37 N6-methylase TrmN6